MNEKTYAETFDRDAVTWRTGSRTNGGGNCVEVTDLPDGGFAVRDSKDPNGPILFFTPGEREAFVLGVKDEGLLG
ncbi:DUF397 domain-containing protein [Actinoplanes sp. NPDC051859]|uniref:DUF397 domain-containing protein n=1 Tax=Actinoplanes sp. NPDC051859 TaxID=3363909 RepID=UPI003799DA86